MFIRIEISNTEKRAKLILNYELIDKILVMLECDSERIKLEVIWSINNLMTKSKDCCEKLLNAKVCGKLLKILHNEKHWNKVKDNLILSLANIAENSIKFTKELIEYGIIDYIENTLKDPNNNNNQMEDCSMILLSIFKSNLSIEPKIVIYVRIVGYKVQ